MRIASLPRKSMTLTATRRSLPGARNGSDVVPRSISKASRSTQPCSAIVAQRAGPAGGAPEETLGLESEPPADPPVHARLDCCAPHRPAAKSCALEAWSGGSSNRPVPRSRAPRSGRDPSLDRPRQPSRVTYQSPGACPGASGEQGSGGRLSRGPPSRPRSPRRRHSAGCPARWCPTRRCQRQAGPSAPRFRRAQLHVSAARAAICDDPPPSRSDAFDLERRIVPRDPLEG